MPAFTVLSEFWGADWAGEGEIDTLHRTTHANRVAFTFRSKIVWNVTLYSFSLSGSVGGSKTNLAFPPNWWCWIGRPSFPRARVRRGCWTNAQLVLPGASRR